MCQAEETLFCFVGVALLYSGYLLSLPIFLKWLYSYTSTFYEPDTVL